jgi:TusA-related sulfurtransferase
VLRGCVVTHRGAIYHPTTGRNTAGRAIGRRPDAGPRLWKVMLLIDLRGVRCPTSWARARVHLEGVPQGGEAELILDDPKGARDIPRAAEALGYAVVAVEACGREWRIRLAV